MTLQEQAAAFSANVGNAHGPNWLDWLAPIKGKAGVSGIELGTWKGESAEWMLENIFTADSAHYFCVDTFAGGEEHRLAGIDCSTLEAQTRSRLNRFGHRAQIFKSLTHTALMGFFKGSKVDFIYVDAAHDAMNVLRDSVLGWELLKVGGVMVWDDYEWNSMPDEVDRPKMAVDAFLSTYAREVEILGMGWQVAVKKIA